MTAFPGAGGRGYMSNRVIKVLVGAVTTTVVFFAIKLLVSWTDENLIVDPWSILPIVLT